MSRDSESKSNPRIPADRPADEDPQHGIPRRGLLQVLAATGLLGSITPGAARPTGQRRVTAQSRRAIATQTTGEWTQQAKLTPDDGDSGDGFGRSVALVGGTAVIGVYSEDNPNGDHAGSAYVFERTDGAWTQQAKLTADDGDNGDEFGETVALTEGKAAIGAPGDEDPNGFEAGAAYVFERTDEAWTQQAKLTPDDGDSYDYFGRSVALAGETAAIGAPGDEDPNGLVSGSAYVFERTNGSWTQQAKLAPDGGDTGDEFGQPVALTEETALIGASDDGNRRFDAGVVYVFERADGAWTQQAKLALDDGDSANLFGRSVTLTEGTALIGTSDDEDPNGEFDGSAHLYERTNGSWTRQAMLNPDDGDSGLDFGRSVALAGGTALIGAPGDEDPNGENAGSAYVFTGGLSPVVGNSPPTDPDGDGRYEDINGDGTFDIVDVQALFANLDSDVVQNNPEAFDFNGDGQVDVVDVQALFAELNEDA